MHVGLLLLRLVVGAVMAAHGGQKLFGWFGGPGLQRTGGFMESLGFRPGPPHAALLGCTELGSGVLLAAGLLTPLGAAAVVGVMVAAVATVHWPNGFFAGDGGYEFNLVLGAAALLVAFTGPGDWSVDHVVGWSMRGWTWGLAALALGAISGLTIVVTRRRRRQVALTAVGGRRAA